ncbi:MaoC family dehydratase N-terminal domain-containing protein [Frankia sp. AgPm24]|uniref:MaoC family dehydratase N-terminal domain-containing protein n=1 Tax=Frankia umida TaxID=573489 RepID=A0ABT0K1S4_9ACTN|nr:MULTISPECIES: MaoC family dehydratase N-terminal domain-containing protein [Frankia]MCK9877702.1 MaoC family dehydratase N-terminal domain-containing protein [Frankia umida]MCK9922998.1 MaoC family dehydratase N-terminal domain-containing protein [Frankia sp. AgPm24]
MSTYTFPVEAGAVLLFSRAVGYPDSAYGDGTAGAPPTFTQSGAQFDPEFHLRPKYGEPWRGSGRTPSGVPTPATSGGGSLHAEQSYEYHRPVRVGDVLTAVQIPGKEWEKAGRRGGSLTFRETITEFRDAAGELVVTARSVVVIPSKVVESPAEGGATAGVAQ